MDILSCYDEKGIKQIYTPSKECRINYSLIPDKIQKYLKYLDQILFWVFGIWTKYFLKYLVFGPNTFQSIWYLDQILFKVFDPTLLLSIDVKIPYCMCPVPYAPLQL